MTILEKLKILIPNAQEEVLEILIDTASTFFKNYCNREIIPESAQPIIMSMTQYHYNQLGSDGLSSSGFSNVSEAYLTDYPDNIINQLNAFRKIKML